MVGPFPRTGDLTCIMKARDADCPPVVVLTGPTGETNAGLRSARGENCCYSDRPIQRVDPVEPFDPFEPNDRKRDFHWRGRALRGPGGVALAEPIERADWAVASPLAVDELSPAIRAALAEVWLRDAAFEHASVASFAQLALDLIALGAPASLVRDAHRAALDEVAHAELSYGIASRLLGRDLGPAPLDAVTPRATLESLVGDCVRDGCYGESVAVMLAHAADAASTDPILKAAYQMIAEDEQRHAELSFQIVAWAIERDPSARAVVVAQRDTLAATLVDSAVVADEDGASVDLRGFGVLDARAEHEVRSRTVREVVLPCVEAMLRRAGDQRATSTLDRAHLNPIPANPILGSAPNRNDAP